MYKIMKKLHTICPSVFAFHMVQDDQGNKIEYQADTWEEAELEAIKVLECMGCGDVRIITDNPYYLDFTYSEDPDFDGEAEKAEALNLLQHIGWGDLRVSDNKPYEIGLIAGYPPEVIIPTHTITINSVEGCTVMRPIIEDIKMGSSVSTGIEFAKKPQSFHFVIDGNEQDAGVPDWIHYESLTDLLGIITFNGVTGNHTIEIVID